MFARCRHFNMQNACCPHCLLSTMCYYMLVNYMWPGYDNDSTLLHMCMDCIVPCRNVNRAL